jgi:hypothetical protein
LLASGVFVFGDEFGRHGGGEVELVLLLVVGGRHVEGVDDVG